MNVECVAFPFEIKLDSSGSRDGDYHIFSTIPRKGIKNYLCRPGEYSTFLIVMNPAGASNNTRRALPAMLGTSINMNISISYYY